MWQRRVFGIYGLKMVLSAVLAWKAFKNLVMAKTADECISSRCDDARTWSLGRWDCKRIFVLLQLRNTSCYTRLPRPIARRDRIVRYNSCVTCRKTINFHCTQRYSRHKHRITPATVKLKGIVFAAHGVKLTNFSASISSFGLVSPLAPCLAKHISVACCRLIV